MVAAPSIDTSRAEKRLTTQAEGFKRRTETFAQQMELMLARARVYILYDAHTSPLQSALPFIWSWDPVKDARARRWWFANYVNRLDRPRGVRNRYVRTGFDGSALDNATTVIGSIDAMSGTFTLDNKSPGAFYVFGAGQVPSHQASGHPLFTGVAKQWRPALAQATRDLWAGHDIPDFSSVAGRILK